MFMLHVIYLTYWEGRKALYYLLCFLFVTSRAVATLPSVCIRIEAPGVRPVFGLDRAARRLLGGEWKGMRERGLML